MTSWGSRTQKSRRNCGSRVEFFLIRPAGVAQPIPAGNWWVAPKNPPPKRGGGSQNQFMRRNREAQVQNPAHPRTPQKPPGSRVKFKFPATQGMENQIFRYQPPHHHLQQHNPTTQPQHLQTPPKTTKHHQTPPNNPPRHSQTLQNPPKPYQNLQKLTKPSPNPSKTSKKSTK